MWHLSFCFRAEFSLDKRNETKANWTQHQGLYTVAAWGFNKNGLEILPLRSQRFKLLAMFDSGNIKMIRNSAAGPNIFFSTFNLFL